MLHFSLRSERTPGKSRTYWYDPAVGGIVEFETYETRREMIEPGAWARRTIREAIANRKATQGDSQ